MNGDAAAIGAEKGSPLGFFNSSMMAFSSACVSCGLASKPVFPCWTMSGIPPTSKPTTGVLQAIDSSTVFGRLSCNDGITNTSAAL